MIIRCWLKFQKIQESWNCQKNFFSLFFEIIFFLKFSKILIFLIQFLKIWKQGKNWFFWKKIKIPRKKLFKDFFFQNHIFRFCHKNSKIYDFLYSVRISIGWNFRKYKEAETRKFFFNFVLLEVFEKFYQSQFNSKKFKNKEMIDFFKK